MPFKKGMPPWNKGLTKEVDKRVKSNLSSHWSKNPELKKVVQLKVSKCNKGRVAWNKGKSGLKGELNGNYGNKWTKEQKEKASKRKSLLWDDLEFREKFNKTHWKNNPKIVERLSKLSSERIIKNIENGNCGNKGYKRGWFTSEKTGKAIYYMSSFELKRFKFLDTNQDVKKFTSKHNIILTYFTKDGKKHKYIPDILIEFVNGNKRLEEIKGYIFEPELFELKNEAALKYCKENNLEFKVIFKENLEKL